MTEFILVMRVSFGINQRLLFFYRPPWSFYRDLDSSQSIHMSSLPTSVFTITIRTLAIFLISATFVGLLVSSDGSWLFNRTVVSSLFVITTKDADIKGLPEF